MRAGAIFLAVFLIVCAAVVIVKFVPSSQSGKVVETAEGDQAIPQPSSTGPYPKAVIDETVFDFGLMQDGGTGTHIFSIRNEGDAELQLVAREQDTTCQCTVGKLRKNTLQPGETTEIEVTWKLKVITAHFQHSALVRTNDPDNQIIKLVVKGKIGRALVLIPPDEWNIGTITTDKPSESTGYLYSESVDDFEIVDVESSSPLLTAKLTPITPKELDELINPDRADRLAEEEAMRAAEDDEASKTDEGEDGDADGEDAEEEALKPLCGYKVTTIMKPEMPVGSFLERLVFKSDIADGKSVTLQVRGRRSGPVQIISTSGGQWIGSKMMLSLGRFPAEKGRKASIMMILDSKEEIEIQPPIWDLDTLKVTLTPMTQIESKNRQRFRVDFEVPPGAPPTEAIKDAKPLITFKTTHPDAETINLHVEFVSY